MIANKWMPNCNDSNILFQYISKLHAKHFNKKIKNTKSGPQPSYDTRGITFIYNVFKSKHTSKLNESQETENNKGNA